MATSAEELLRLTSESPPDFTVLDTYKLPDPVNFIRRLRTISNSPVNVFSSNQGTAFESTLYKAGVCGVIDKPADGGEILGRLALGLARCEKGDKAYFQEVRCRPVRSLAKWQFQSNIAKLADSWSVRSGRATTIVKRAAELRDRSDVALVRSRTLRERSADLLEDLKFTYRSHRAFGDAGTRELPTVDLYRIAG